MAESESDARGRQQAARQMSVFRTSRNGPRMIEKRHVAVNASWGASNTRCWRSKVAASVGWGGVRDAPEAYKSGASSAAADSVPGTPASASFGETRLRDPTPQRRAATSTLPTSARLRLRRLDGRCVGRRGRGRRRIRGWPGRPRHRDAAWPISRCACIRRVGR